MQMARTGFSFGKSFLLRVVQPWHIARTDADGAARAAVALRLRGDWRVAGRAGPHEGDTRQVGWQGGHPRPAAHHFTRAALAPGAPRRTRVGPAQHEPGAPHRRDLREGPDGRGAREDHHRPDRHRCRAIGRGAAHLRPPCRLRTLQPARHVAGARRHRTLIPPSPPRPGQSVLPQSTATHLSPFLLSQSDWVDIPTDDSPTSAAAGKEEV